MMNRLLRGVYIVFIVLRYGLDELVLTSFQKPGLRLLARVVSIGRDLSAPRGQRLREALEHLGPIFVKFGQVLSRFLWTSPTSLWPAHPLRKCTLPSSKTAMA